MELTNFAAHFLEISSGILRLNTASIPRRRAAVIWTYSRLKLLKIAQRMFKFRPVEVMIHGWTVHFSTLRDLITMYEEIFVQQLYFFRSRTKEQCIIDCGANIGLSVIYFKDLYPNSRIIAFEPHSATCQKLVENIVANGLTDVTVYQYALADRPGEGHLHTNSTRPGYIGMSLNSKGGAYDGSEEVPCVLLSDFLAEQVDMLKMDIEGSELPVLQELEEKKKLALVDNLIIEYHHHIDGSDVFSRLLSLLERNGFGYQISASHRALLKDLRKPSEIIVVAYRKAE
jgi:FkbM family methyltransferase